MDELYSAIFLKTIGIKIADTTLTRKELIKCVAGGSPMKQNSDSLWLFNPSAIRQKFKVAFDEILL